MKCPVCGQEMVKQDFGVDVDVCSNGCKGIWFDQGELVRLDETNEGLGPALQAALRSGRNNQGQRAPLACPKCSLPMHLHKYKRAKEVNVDECYQCGGFFLDSGELNEIRDQYMNDAEIADYTDKLAKTVPEYVQETLALEKMKQRLAAIQKFTGMLKIHYWRQL
jgi:Zn-finger nucleic acid-binding protein